MEFWRMAFRVTRCVVVFELAHSNRRTLQFGCG